MVYTRSEYMYVGNGQILFAIFLEAAPFPLGSVTTLGRKGGGVGFLVYCRKEDLVCTRNEYMYVVSKVLLSLNTGQ